VEFEQGSEFQSNAFAFKKEAKRDSAGYAGAVFSSSHGKCHTFRIAVSIMQTVVSAYERS
jgi:hypothetical protein